MTTNEHDTQRDWVRASLMAPDTSAERHGVYPLRPRPAPEPPRAA